MFDAFVTLAFSDSIFSRLVVCVVACIGCFVLIVSGKEAIRTKTAEESGKRRIVNSLFGNSNTYEGSKAVFIGWSRVVCGVVAIIFGIVFIFTGPFLK